MFNEEALRTVTVFDTRADTLYLMRQHAKGPRRRKITALKRIVAGRSVDGEIAGPLPARSKPAANTRHHRSPALASAFATICWDLDRFTRTDASYRIPNCVRRKTAVSSVRPGALPTSRPTLGLPAAGLPSPRGPVAPLHRNN